MSRRDGQISNTHDDGCDQPAAKGCNCQWFESHTCDHCNRDLLESALPEYRSEPAERLGREGMVTVWDDLGRYVGCMGVSLWLHLLTASRGPVDG